MSIDRVRLVSLPVRSDERGQLSFMEVGEHVPFDVKRIYYLYNTPEGQSRGAHAHKALHQLIVAISGSFEISLDDGLKQVSYVLDRPDQGLYLPPGLWRDLRDFSEHAVCLVLASMPYSEDDYYRDYDEFKAVYGV